MLAEIQHFLSNDGFYLSLTVVILNITLAYLIPIFHKNFPSKVTQEINTITVVNRGRLFVSSLFLIIIVLVTVVVSPLLQKTISEYTNTSVLNLSKLT